MFALGAEAIQSIAVITRESEGFAKVEQIGKGSPLVMSIR
jgi:hypothetical protein